MYAALRDLRTPGCSSDVDLAIQELAGHMDLAKDGRVTVAAKPARPLRDESKREWDFSFRPHQIPAKGK
jgi:hypothetical protein